MRNLTALVDNAGILSAMLRKTVVVLSLMLCAPAAFAASQGGPIPVPLPLFPSNNWWNTDISQAPVLSNVPAYIPVVVLHADWGTDNGDGTLYGFPFIQVDGSQPIKTVIFEVPEESDGVDHTTETSVPFYPIPDEAITQYGWIEVGPPGNTPVDDPQIAGADRHMLIVDTTNNRLYELYNASYNETTSQWYAYSGAFFDMNTNDRRPDTWTSSDASGMALLPGLIRYDEVYGPDEINHAFRFTVQHAFDYVFPASHKGFYTTGPALPYGARFRLKNTQAVLDKIALLPPAMQKVFRAMMKYGLIFADQGSNMYISGAYDSRWDMGVVSDALNDFNTSDFELIQLGWKPQFSYIISAPATTGVGDTASITVNVFDANYAPAAAYTGTIHFTSTDGAATLPANYTFTLADGGAHTFSVTMRTAGRQSISANEVADPTVTGLRTLSVAPAIPTGLVATATTTTSVGMSWTAAAGAASYEIVRVPGFASPATTVSTAYIDNTATAGQSYVYRVRGVVAPAISGALSAPDVATTIFFTDDPLFANTTVIKSIHIDQLRQAVNAMRATAGLVPQSFTDPTLSNAVPVKTVHVQQLRDALAQARATLGLAAQPFTDATLTSATLVKAVHLQDLRAGVK